MFSAHLVVVVVVADTLRANLCPMWCNIDAMLCVIIIVLPTKPHYVATGFTLQPVTKLFVNTSTWTTPTTGTQQLRHTKRCTQSSYTEKPN